ncbi:hypothetical protein BC628DRAFT_1474983 [Trametes gibbosa]|nr:hypothetical protein BC628DRAFT_1474983 [Trametes gibbosa]
MSIWDDQAANILLLDSASDHSTDANLFQGAVARGPCPTTSGPAQSLLTARRERQHHLL